MSNINENKFYQALEDIFTGAEIEGESGYVNLLKIKQQYYQQILQEFKNQVDQNSLIAGDFKEEFFDKLYSFFEKYFSESGSVYFVKTANWQRVYEKIYTDNKDVVLFWKTHMLYYVKSDILFQSINVDIDDEQGQTYKFYFDVGKLEQQQNNEKKEIIFEYRETQQEENQNIYIFDVMYSEKGRTTKKEQISKKTKISEEILEKAFKTFKKQSEVDFFINKNAQKFLEEQLDLYLHQILLNEENKFHQNRLDQLKTIKEYAQKIISFISQFEDELVKVWNKPKFAKNSNYVITIDKLSKEILEKIKNHSNLKEQIQEWKDLGIVGDDFDFSKVLEKNLLGDNSEQEYKYLPIDTKYFKDLELDILGLFDDIDEELDGRLIQSENYQALNTLQNKYREKIQCCYIDPPFNTGSDFAYKDNFQDSSWLSLMNDRIELARNLLRDDGSFYLHLDDNADYLGRVIGKNIFGEDNFLNEIVWKKTNSPKSQSNNFGDQIDIILFYQKNAAIFNMIYKSFTKEQLKNYSYNDNDGRGYYQSVSLVARGGQANSGRKNFEWQGIKDMWLYKKETLDKFLEENKIIKTKNGYRLKDFLNEKKGAIVSNLWDDKDVPPIQKNIFDTQKPEGLLKRILTASSNKQNYILDFFSGSATTIATAHKLNRKWIGVEMGEHFNTVALPRMKTVLSGKISGISKELEKENKLKKGGFFKYYELEQYEDTLRNMKYSHGPATIFNNKNPFEQYIFFADQKFADVLDTQSDKIQLNFENLYANIDLSETISNLFGLPIKKITPEAVILKDPDSENGEREIKTDTSGMSQEEKLELVRIMKPLLWWGK